ncbi:uncharacterized protein KY384_006165 [Bacidia gigantensis]|uniref:uncharacterized protein n=1 Tax=Bacidia gigantensis TaxID=2732470 RepID=UPI001D04FF56|nr:uncharacterized protein KY384_006165 [Bacidia gigantensis]KAG8529528.1 hypothetical protein KY384_006165 [Bacidia gigantensis]
MAPPVESFLASELQNHINQLPNGKRRKGGDVDLKKCSLHELVQYSCYLEGDPKASDSVIKCKPCADGLMVETTAFEGGD